MTTGTNYKATEVEFYPGTNRPKKPANLPSGEVEVLSEGGLCEALWEENRCCMLGPRAGAMGDGFVDTYNKLPIHVTHVLTAIPDTIILTREDIVKMIGDAFDAGGENEYRKHFGSVPNQAPDKQQYINQLIKGE